MCETTKALSNAVSELAQAARGWLARGNPEGTLGTWEPWEPWEPWGTESADTLLGRFLMSSSGSYP